MEKWLENHLIKLGRLNEDGISRKITGRWCRRCGQRTLRGLDSDVMGIAYTVDDVPVTARGECRAVFQERATYILRAHSSGGGLYADYRTAEMIAAHSADDEPVVVEHRCGNPLHSADYVEKFQPQRLASVSDEPPF